MNVRELVTWLGFKVDTASLNNAERANKRLERGAQNTAAAFRRLGMAIGGALSVRQLQLAADEMQSIRARISLLPQTVGDVGAAFDEVAKHATDARTSIEGYANFYVRIGAVSGKYIKTQEELLRITDTVSKALVVSGATTEETMSVMTQFSQALGAGTLQGEEFRSMAEAAPQFMDKLAESMGVPRENLKKMAQDGKITSKQVIEATKNMADYFDDRFRRMPMTIGQAMKMIANRIKLGIDRINRESMAVTRIANGMLDAFDKLVDVTKRVIDAFGGFKNILDLVAISIGLVMGLKLITWLIDISLAIRRIAAAVGILRIVTMSFLAIGLVAAFALIVLAIQDLVVWLRGGDSVLGKFVGSWAEFKKKSSENIAAVKRAVKDFVNWLRTPFDWIDAQIDKIMAKLSRFKSILPNLVPFWMKGLLGVYGPKAYTDIPRSPTGDIAGGRAASNVVVNARADLHLPQGTPEDHVRIVKTAAEEAMNFALGQQMRAAALNLSMGEY